MPEWPDWRGQACAIIASGPSTKKEDLSLLKGRLQVLAIKRNIELVPWADAVYGCDRPWWRSVRGLPDFPGLKMSYDERACREFGLTQVRIPKGKDHRILTGETGVVGSGGNSGFQALNLAIQFGAKRILLVGFDYNGEHWYGRNQWTGANNPDRSSFERWRAALNGAAPEIARLGVEVINASANSTVKVFPKRTIEAAVREWGL